MPAHWSEQYLSLPFADLGRDRSGVDCWGLVTLAYREQRGIDLPSYTERYASLAERAEIASVMVDGRSLWAPVPRPAEWDVIMFRRAWGPSHVGIVVGSGQFIHASQSAGAVLIERYNAGRWARTLEGFYRYRS